MLFPITQQVSPQSKEGSKDRILSISSCGLLGGLLPEAGDPPVWKVTGVRRKNKAKKALEAFSEEQTGSFLEKSSKPFLESPWPQLHRLCALGQITAKANGWGYPQISALVGVGCGPLL